MPISLGSVFGPDATLRIDASGTAFGDAPTFIDYTQYLMAKAGARITWGRQDELSEPPPATCTFELKNDTGAWTPGNALAPAGWDVGARVRVSVEHEAVSYDRFDGYVDSIEPTWVGGVHTWNVVKVSCTDITARLARSQPLKSLVVQEMLADDPAYLYPLSEPTGSAAGDVTANGNAA